MENLFLATVDNAIEYSKQGHLQRLLVTGWTLDLLKVTKFWIPNK